MVLPCKVVSTAPYELDIDVPRAVMHETAGPISSVFMGNSRRRGEPGVNEVVDQMALGVMGNRTAVRWAMGTLVVGGALSAALIFIWHWHWLVSVVQVMSGLTFAVYGYDKSAARRGAFRVPERVLHLLSLLGGAPGALAGQKCFRHKTAKAGFQVIFWITAIIQAGLIAYFLWSRG